MSTLAQPAADESLRYPRGRFAPPSEVTAEDRRRWIDEIAALPPQVRAAVQGYDDAKFDTPYRPGGWTVRQLVHHIPDSHMNALTRFKLALTEDTPTIKPYEEARWAELPDTRLTPPEVSLALLELLHVRWLHLLRAMTPADFARTYIHPEHGKVFTLDVVLALYAWHSRHHLAHLTGLRTRMGW